MSEHVATAGARRLRGLALTVAAAMMAVVGGIGGASAEVQRQSFSDPQIGGRWLDVCYAKGACREKLAADTYCRQKSYERAVNYSSRVSKALHKNARIGDNSICFSTVGNCHRFVRVTCERTIARPRPSPQPVPGPYPGGKGDIGRDLAIGAIGAIIGGIASGAMQPREPQPEPVYGGGGGGGLSPQHIDWCYARYRSYRASTNTYTSNGGQQRYCNSPYN